MCISIRTRHTHFMHRGIFLPAVSYIYVILTQDIIIYSVCVLNIWHFSDKTYFMCLCVNFIIHTQGTVHNMCDKSNLLVVRISWSFYSNPLLRVVGYVYAHKFYASHKACVRWTYTHFETFCETHMHNATQTGVIHTLIHALQNPGVIESNPP